jgi:hypothetical protein
MMYSPVLAGENSFGFVGQSMLTVLPYDEELLNQVRNRLEDFLTDILRSCWLHRPPGRHSTPALARGK